MSKKTPGAPKEIADYQPRATSSRSTYIMIGVAVAVAALIIGGFVWSNTRSYPPVDDKVLAENAAFIVGPQDAKVTVDVFEDFTCPACKQFEGQSGTALAAAVQAGQLRVRYHLLTFMDEKSPSGDYSSRGAGAILCLARGGDSVQVFNRLHAELFAKAGGDSDPDNAAIAVMAAQAGASEATQKCIADGAQVDAAKKMADASRTQLANSNEGKVATPTVLVAGEAVEGIMDGDAWIAKLITGGPSN
ncbi:DsbA family protein [Gordonia alkaliphila]|uniref:DsbA family protein n=1 Tax=Gordonia alkaliphila TaxID=1053547 RepID=UPI001FF180F5|nr:thioredoxin domain-containing protein [Gordonia alkaliphila]MCK0438228.1 DsbA family protein [Gordonia alkaliphila]